MSIEIDSSATVTQDPNERFLRLWTHHEPELRAFVRACIPRSIEVDEIMQEVSLVAWKKFDSLTDPAQFARWAALIARYEIQMARRRFARDRLVLDEDIVEKISREGIEELPLRRQQLAALDQCVEKLPREHRELTLAAYAPGASIRELAANKKRSEGSVYQLLARIRQELLQCVERTIAREARSV